MQADEIALELTKSIIERGLIKPLEPNDLRENINKQAAANVAEIYDIIFKAVDKTFSGE